MKCYGAHYECKQMTNMNERYDKNKLNETVKSNSKPLWWKALSLKKLLAQRYKARAIHTIFPSAAKLDDMKGLTCRKGRIAPLIRNESAAMPAMPSLGSRSCRKDMLGALWLHEWLPQHTMLLASGCELWRMMREPEFGEDVISTGGICCCTLIEYGDRCPGMELRTLSFDTERANWREDMGVVEARLSHVRHVRQRTCGVSW